MEANEEDKKGVDGIDWISFQQVCGVNFERGEGKRMNDRKGELGHNARNGP